MDSSLEININHNNSNNNGNQNNNNSLTSQPHHHHHHHQHNHHQQPQQHYLPPPPPPPPLLPPQSLGQSPQQQCQYQQQNQQPAQKPRTLLEPQHQQHLHQQQQEQQHLQQPPPNVNEKNPQQNQFSKQLLHQQQQQPPNQIKFQQNCQIQPHQSPHPNPLQSPQTHQTLQVPQEQQQHGTQQQQQRQQPQLQPQQTQPPQTHPQPQQPHLNQSKPPPQPQLQPQSEHTDQSQRSQSQQQLQHLPQPQQHEQPHQSLTVNDSDNDVFTNDLDLFFANGHYNSCQAIDDLMRSIEESQDEALAEKALALYQKHYATLERPWDHVTFMYGLGLIYMHFNAYKWAVKSFREAIYVQPNFARSRDVHTRLGLIFKATGRYKLSEKHFSLAINDTRPSSGISSKLELNFHLAHLYEIQGNLNRAVETYERLLLEKDLPPKLSANIHRQLGWIHFNSQSNKRSPNQTTENDTHNSNDCNNHQHDHKDDTFCTQKYQNLSDPAKIDAALNYLNTSYKTDSDSRTSYYLGRCFTNIGHLQDAFALYRRVLDKDEPTADTWCSIGVLYHRQNQPTDALQAYIRSVQFDKNHTAAWLNLGILYESHNQFNDALKCYKHALRSSSNGTDKSLQARVRYIQRHLSEIQNSSSESVSKAGKQSQDRLLNLEDLWNLESKISSEIQASQQADYNNKGGNVNQTKSSTSQSNSSTSTSQTNKSINQTVSIPTNNSATSTISMTPMEVDCQSINGNNKEETIHQLASSSTHAPATNSIDHFTNNATRDNVDSKTNDSKSNVMSTTTPVSNTSVGAPNNHIGSLIADCQQLEARDESNTDSTKSQSSETKDFVLNQVLTNGASKDSGISSNSSTNADCALAPSQNTDCVTNASYDDMSARQVIEAYKNSPKPRRIDINLLSDENKPPCVFPHTLPYPKPTSDQLFPTTPSVFVMSKNDLASRKLQDICQSNPISIVRNIASVLKLDLGLFSTKTLVESNPNQEIEIVSHLYQQNVDSMDEQSQPQPQSHSHLINSFWSCERQKSSSTISNYANYQVASFKDSIIEERDNKLGSANKASNSTKELETDSNESASGTSGKRSINPNLVANSARSIEQLQANQPQYQNSQQRQQQQNSPHSQQQQQQHLQQPEQTKSSPPSNKKLKRDQPAKIKQVKSADKIDLSDEKKWRVQLNELNKLPHFIKCISASNMLTHIGKHVPDVNTVKMSMHVPGCRILGNKTPETFCPISLNVGPGDYEWYAIAPEYKRSMSRLCNRNGFELDDINWWPKMIDLQRYNIPVYKFSQRPGDLVWVNSGTFYWIQAVGWCNSIHWNVGPLNLNQYKMASESIEINKLLFRKSEVPLVQLTWNIVMNINLIPDNDLHNSVVDVLRRSLGYCVVVKDIVEQSKQKITMSCPPRSSNGNGITATEPKPRCAKYCSLCEAEVFNITFVTKNDDNTTHCLECARRADPDFNNYDIRQEYDLECLMKVHDKFVMNRKKFFP